uniref:Putative transcriptional activator Crp family protein n=1 Tax=uncultured bacterium 1062 TaxID=548898 RepID=B8R8X7_9BACT|nr:putative transcriptional activator Crp family protein [uncultured bacterium 1062]
MLSPAELVGLASHARHTRHLAGEALAIESSEITGYANVTDGVVKLSRVLRDGRQQLVGLQFAPDLMGRLFGTESPLTAEAASDVQLCRMPRVVLEALVDSSTRLKQRLLDQSLQDLDEAREWMVTLGRKSAAERVASLLLLIASRSVAAGCTNSATFDLPIGRADMADFLGVTIETVSRQISKLRHEGVIVISSHRHVVVPDLAALRSRAG